MSTFGAGQALLAVLVWLGMVIAISFIEAPLKFTAPGVTLAIGLGIGRKVFRALNSVEGVLGVVAVVGLVQMARSDVAYPAAITVAVAVAIACLVAQVVGVRPALTRRSNEVLAGDGTKAEDKRSTAHYYYVGFEVVKVVALIVAGVMLLVHG
ncbi:MAG: hypothetical protein QM728_05620 [Gordonia sp. (in: high G+C Gram-positive bacteria)]|uniref:hypothetical protein n=1 Tax=Gordonia sp. (in: high G+C Gram-positive bacteria) TaxID=84139 RepID=UPI0039E39B43